MKKKYTLSTLLFLINTIFGVINSKAQSVAAGGGFTFAICSDSTLYAWGSNQDGQLGTGDNLDYTSPVQVVEFKWCDGCEGLANVLHWL